MSALKAGNAHELFWLASYAHRTLVPVFEELRALEPTSAMSIEMTFGDERYPEPWHLTVVGHWKRHGMILQEICLTTTAGVDRAAEKVRAVVASLSLEAVA